MSEQSTSFPGWHATTIVSVRKGGKVVIAGDGQVSVGQSIMKSNARKVRALGKGDVIAGFAGATADAFTLFERLEQKLEQYPSQLMRGIGSGGNYAMAAARALYDMDLGAEEIARRAMQIAADICIYTNDTIRVEVLDANEE